MFLCRLDDVPDGGARGFDPAHTGRDTVPVVRPGAWDKPLNDIHIREA